MYGEPDYFKTKTYNRLAREIERWVPHVSKPICLLGDIGVGKTRTVKEVAKSMGYELVVVDQLNAESMDLYSLVSTIGFNKTIVLLDRPHEWIRLGELKKLLRDAVNPVVIEAEKGDYGRYSGWTNILWCDPPPRRWIGELVRNNAIVSRINWRAITGDVRQAILIAFGSEGYEGRKFIEQVDRLIKGADAEIERSHLPLILDTLLEHSYGYDWLYNIKLMVSADLLNRYKHLRLHRKTFRYRGVVDRFYKKLRVVRNGGSH